MLSLCLSHCRIRSQTRPALSECSTDSVTPYLTKSKDMYSRPNQCSMKTSGFLVQCDSYTVKKYETTACLCVISGFHRDVVEIFALLGYYAALNGSSVLTFRDNLSVPSSRVKKSSSTSWFLKIGEKGCPETSAQNCHSTLCNIPEERRSQLRVFL